MKTSITFELNYAMNVKHLVNLANVIDNEEGNLTTIDPKEMMDTFLYVLDAIRDVKAIPPDVYMCWRDEAMSWIDQ